MNWHIPAVLLACAMSTMTKAADTFPHVPIPTAEKDWVRPDDYPVAAKDKSESALVVVRVFVSPEGKPESCKPVLKTRSQTLADSSCRLVMKRASFAPAEDSAGHAVHGTMTRLMSWTAGSLAGSSPSQDWVGKVPVDLELSVPALPSGMGKSADIHVALAIGADGTATGCSPVSAPPPEQAKLASVACREAAKDKWSPLRNSSGTPVASVQDILVRFSAAN